MLPFQNSDHRQRLISFHDGLFLLAEALFVMLLTNLEDADFKEALEKEYQVSLFTQDQIANPKEVILAFFYKNPMTYIIRELEVWLEIAIGHDGLWRDNLASPLARAAYLSGCVMPY